MDVKARKDLAHSAKEWHDQARLLRDKYPVGDPNRDVAAVLDGCAADVEHTLEKAEQRERTKVLKGNGDINRRKDDPYDEDEDEFEDEYDDSVWNRK